MDPAPIVAAGVAAAAAGLGWAIKTWRARRDAEALDWAGAPPGQWRAAARDVRAELRVIRDDIRTSQGASALTGHDAFPEDALRRNRELVMRAASTDQGEAIEAAYRRVRVLRRHVDSGASLPPSELAAASEAVDEAIRQLDEFEAAVKTRALRRAGSAPL